MRPGSSVPGPPRIVPITLSSGARGAAGLTEDTSNLAVSDAGCAQTEAPARAMAIENEKGSRFIGNPWRNYIRLSTQAPVPGLDGLAPDRHARPASTACSVFYRGFKADVGLIVP